MHANASFAAECRALPAVYARVPLAQADNIARSDVLLVMISLEPGKRLDQVPEKLALTTH
jgi:hypothetical protein